MIRIVFMILQCFTAMITVAQKNMDPKGKYQVLLHRKDGIDIVFNFLIKDSSGSKHLFILNGAERIPTEKFRAMNDSIFFQMPVFESSFRAQVDENGAIRGMWIVQLAQGFREMPFTAYPADYRFRPGNNGKNLLVEGRWAVTLSRIDTNKTRPAVGEFIQKGSVVTGTFLTPTGDYRYLEGIVSGDSLKLSTFDGHHSFLFLAKRKSEGILEGMFYSGAAHAEKWTAVKDPNAKIPEGAARTRMREGETRLNFRFPDLDSNIVSINDERFKHKVVIVQIMGSWCANCMDETRFLSDYYLQNRDRGFEVVSLCYERSTNFSRSVASIRKFQQRFNVQYPLLVSGVTSDDTAKTEKTLPQLDRISAFPSFLVLNKKGEVVNIHLGFEGPGTGEHHEKFKKEFHEMIERLLSGK